LLLKGSIFIMKKNELKIYLSETFIAAAIVFQVSAGTISSYNLRAYLLKIIADLFLIVVMVANSRWFSQNLLKSVDRPSIHQQPNFFIHKSSFINLKSFLVNRQSSTINFIVLIVFYPLLTLAYSLSPIFGFEKWLNLLLGPMVSIVGVYYLTSTWTEYRLKTYKYFLSITAVTLSLFAVIINPFTYDGLYSITALKWSHVIYARYLASAFVLLYILLILSQNNKEKICLSLVLILTAPGIYFTSLRASLIGLAVVIPLIIITSFIKKEPRRNIIATFAVILFSVLFTIILSFTFNSKAGERTLRISEFNNIEEIKDGAFTSRIEAYKIAIERIQKNPIAGLGFGGFRTYYKNNLPLWIKYPHNIFLETQVELGIGGTLLLLYLLYLIFKKSYNLLPYFFYFFLFAFILSLFAKDLPGQGLLFLGLGLSISSEKSNNQN